MTTAPVDRPPRPAAVTVAFWLQLATAVVLLAAVGLTVVAAVQFDGAIDRAAARVPGADPDEVSGERFGNVFMTTLLSLPALVLAGWFAATARPVLRGGATARILVYVGGGAQLLCSCVQGCLGFALLPFLLTGDEFAGPAAGPDGQPLWEESEFLETLYADSADGDLLVGMSGLGMVVALLLTLAVVLLLSLPPGSRYFRPAEDRESAGTPTGPLPAVAPGQPVAVPFGAPGHPAYLLPPGYMICPDPSRHLPDAPTTPPDTSPQADGD